MWLFVLFMCTAWGIALLRFCFDYGLVEMGNLRGVPVKCERHATFRAHTTAILLSAKMRNFMQRFPLEHTPIDHVRIVAVKMFNAQTVGFIHCELHGIDSSCTCVTIRGDTTATVQRILTPSYDVCVAVVNPRPAVGGARPAPFMAPLLRSLVTPKTKTAHVDDGEALCAAVRGAHIVIEAVAGMMDECELSSSEQATLECQEETGETVRQIDLSRAAPPFGTSQGLLDEQTTLWCSTRKLPSDDYVEEYLANMKSDLMITNGNADEGECTLKVLVPTAWLHLVGDGKLHVAQAHFMREDAL